MANKTFSTRIKNKRDTESNWASKNPVLLNGEIAIVDTTSGETRFKVGDGTKKYSQLPFQDAATLANYVKTTRKINNKALSSDISLTASDVGALPSTTTALKNPNALTFTGAVTDIYDGSAAKTVAIPSVDSSLSSTSTNAIQNKAVNDALAAKVNRANPVLKGDVAIEASDNTMAVVVQASSFDDTIDELSLGSATKGGVVVGGLATDVDPELEGREDLAVSYAMMKTYVDNKSSSSGGSGKFIITSSMDEDVGDYVINKTVDEVVAAYEAGRMIYLNNTNESAFIPLTVMYRRLSNYTFIFEWIIYSKSGATKKATLYRETLTGSTGGTLSTDYLSMGSGRLGSFTLT